MKPKSPRPPADLRTALRLGASDKLDAQRSAEEQTRRKAEANRRSYQRSLVSLRKEWVTSGKIFQLIRENAAKGMESLSISDGDNALAEVLNKVDGLSAKAKTFMYRPSDDFPEIEGRHVEVTWRKK